MNVEQAFLAQLLDAPASETRRTAITTEAFSGPSRDVYRAILAVANDHQVVTCEAVVAELRESGSLERIGGPEAIERLSEHTGMHVIDGARAELVDAATRRLLMEAGKSAHGMARDGQSRDASAAMQDALRIVAALRGSTEAVPLKSMRDHLESWARRVMTADDMPARVPLGAFADELGEHAPGTLGLIYGFSQSGKSHVMQWMERVYAEHGYGTLRVSCEDPDRLNEGRLMTEAARIDATKPHRLSADDYSRITRAMSVQCATWDRRLIVEHPSSVEVICHTMRTAASQRGVQVVFVDYAQLLRVSTGKGDTQEQRLSEAVDMLKQTAKEIGAQLWLGSQVTVRDPKKVNKPSPFDLKGARSIYEKAEFALALWVDGDQRFAEIQKNKLGKCDVMAQQIVGPGGMVEDLARVRYEREQSGVYQSDDYSAGRAW